MSNDYEFIKLLEIRFADPISSMKLKNNYVVTGTMMGRVNLYNINDGKTYRLSELNSENISDISYNEKEELFYVGIGDEEIRGYDIKNLSEDSNTEKGQYKYMSQTYNIQTNVKMHSYYYLLNLSLESN